MGVKEGVHHAFDVRVGFDVFNSRPEKLPGFYAVQGESIR
jgi:hypothetical protein